MAGGAGENEVKEEDNVVEKAESSVQLESRGRRCGTAYHHVCELECYQHSLRRRKRP